MSAHADWTDEELLAQLRAAGTVADGPPEVVLAAAKAAFGLRALDAELAELVADSLESGSLVRGATTVRLVTFEAAGVTVDLEVTPEGERHRLLGQLSGASGRPVQLDAGGRQWRVAVDELGRFAVDDVAAGPLRLRCTSAAGVPVVTSWLTI